MTPLLRQRAPWWAILGVGLGIFAAAGAEISAFGDNATSDERGALRVESHLDVAAAGHLSPGQPVDWEVAVSTTDQFDGEIMRSLRIEGEARDMSITIEECAPGWISQNCRKPETVLPSTPLEGIDQMSLGIQEPGEERLLRISVTLSEGASAGAENQSCTLYFTATADGEKVQVSTDGNRSSELATTGARAIEWLWATAVVLVGIGALLTNSRRRKEQRQ